jgi:hypothetical protein
MLADRLSARHPYPCFTSCAIQEFFRADLEGNPASLGEKTVKESGFAVRRTVLVMCCCLRTRQLHAPGDTVPIALVI